MYAILALLPASHPLAVPSWLLTLSGKILCYAIVAVALDLVWGYAGMLSLGHGIFFALGRYAMGMYLMRQAAGDGLPAFMSFSLERAAWFWWGTQHFTERWRWWCWFPVCWPWFSAGLPFARRSKGSISRS